jgi:hypothetical protein
MFRFVFYIGSVGVLVMATNGCGNVASREAATDTAHELVFKVKGLT